LGLTQSPQWFRFKKKQKSPQWLDEVKERNIMLGNNGEQAHCVMLQR